MIPRWSMFAFIFLAAAASGQAQLVPAQAVLAVADDLQLTQAQIDKLHALERAQFAATSKSAASFLRAEADLLDAMRGEDLILRRAALEKRSKIAIDAEIARLQADKDSRAVLLPDQRQRLASMTVPVAPTACADAYPWQQLVAPPPISRTVVAATIDSGTLRMKVTPSYVDIFID